MDEKVDLFGKARETRSQTRAAARSMAELARMVTLAGIGAVALAKDKTEHLAARLVERGTQAEREAGRMAEGFTVRTQREGGSGRARVELRMGGLLSRMNVPTREDIAAVNAKIAALSAKIDAMAGGGSPAEGPAADIDPSSQI